MIRDYLRPLVVGSVGRLILLIVAHWRVIGDDDDDDDDDNTACRETRSRIGIGKHLIVLAKSVVQLGLLVVKALHIAQAIDGNGDC